MNPVSRLPRNDGYQDALVWLRDDVLKQELASFEADPPSDEYQREYLRELQDLDRHVRSKITPSEGGEG